MNQSGAKPLMQADNIHFSYPGSPPVIREIELRLHSGQRVALIGPNGSGKTTLFLLLCGVLTPQQGTIRVKGNPLHPGSFNPAIGYLFQSPDDQLFSTTLEEDVAFGPRNMGLTAAEVAARVSTALSDTGCRELATRSPHHLSGGEKRMAAIATLLAMAPELILLDEPTSNLDSRNRRQLIRIIHQLPQSLIISSHDLEFLLETCPEVILLDEGRIIATGATREIMADADLMQAHGLEKPHSLIPHVPAEHHHL